MQTIIKITVLYFLTTVLYLPYSTLDALWHNIVLIFALVLPRTTNKTHIVCNCATPSILHIEKR